MADGVMLENARALAKRLIRLEIREEAENGAYDDQYAEYIMEHSAGDRVICNGDTLTRAMEDGYLWEDFLDSLGAPNAL